MKLPTRIYPRFRAARFHPRTDGRIEREPDIGLPNRARLTTASEHATLSSCSREPTAKIIESLSGELRRLLRRGIANARFGQFLKLLERDPVRSRGDSRCFRLRRARNFLRKKRGRRRDKNGELEAPLRCKDTNGGSFELFYMGHFSGDTVTGDAFKRRILLAEAIMVQVVK